MEANLQRAERLRQSILAAAFSGRLAPAKRLIQPSKALIIFMGLLFFIRDSRTENAHDLETTGCALSLEAGGHRE